MPDAASTAAVQPPPFILDLRNRSPPASPSQVASDAARSSSPSSLGESEGTASTNATSEAPSDPLREQIIAGLIGSPKPTVPGKTEKDRAYAYRRTIPTMTLYSERGLSIYEEITKTKVCSQLPFHPPWVTRGRCFLSKPLRAVGPTCLTARGLVLRIMQLVSIPFAD